MTPKEKAEELISKMLGWQPMLGEENTSTFNAKQCALIAVEEIIDTSWKIYGKYHDNTYLEYWQEVKQEIGKL